MRILDILISLLAILLLSPLLLVIMVCQKLLGEGEVFYVQTRMGQYEKTFGLIKFATMLKESPNIGAGDITLVNDPRVLPHGRFLRKSKINELPQLINVLLGHMSIVGPRPLTVKNYSYYDLESKSIISSMLPGLTGVGSIVFRDEEALLKDVGDPIALYEKVISPYKADLEKYYHQNISLGLYFRVIFLTALIIIRPKTDISKYFENLPAPPNSLKQIMLQK